MSVITVFRSAAFVDLVQDVNRFGAVLHFEAEAKFGKELVAQAIRQRVCARRKIPLGNVLYLLHQGRKLAGLAGQFIPTDDSLANAICLRDAGQRLEHAGYAIDLNFRKRSIVFTPTGKRVLVLAQQKGYALAALRRLHKQFVGEGEFDQIQLFTYLHPAEISGLIEPLYNPARKSLPISPEKFPIFGLPPPKPNREVSLPAGVV